MGGTKLITVDTHVIIWDALKPGKLSGHAKEAIAQANKEDGIIFCEISLWEIAMLVQKKRITIDTPYQEFIKLVLSSNKYQLQRITPKIAELSTQLPEDINKDPADRIIVATSIVCKGSLVTADSNLIQSHGVLTIW